VLNDIPAILKQFPNWIVWKSVLKDGKLTKIPFDAKTGQWAKSNDPLTWVSFEQAVSAADPLTGSDYSGIGFELHGTSIVGLDFDGSIDKKGIIDPYVSAILDLLGNPYTEISPSSRGLHAYVECEALPGGKRKMSQGHVGIEIYHGQEGGRYLTVTGDHVRGNGVPQIVDISLPYLLITQNKDKKFRRLWLGDTSDHNGDESSADIALMNRLAVITNGDAVKMEAYFGKSALGQREKWTDRPDYPKRTIQAALDYIQLAAGKPAPSVTKIEFHTPAVPDPDGEYVIAPADKQQDGWFPLGDISLIGGPSGSGKTTWIFETLHKQKQGYEVLGHKTFKRLFHVLAYDRGENAFARTMRRLNLSKTDIPTTPLPLSFGTEAVQNIVNEIEKLNPVPSVVFIEGLDMLIDDANKKSTVSPFMRQLQEAAAHFHVAMVGSVGAPKTKRGEDYAAKRDKISGSEAWGRNCETVCVLEFSEEDDGTTPRRELTVLPRNAPAEKFSLEFQFGRLVQVAAQPDEEKSDTPGGRPPEARQKVIDAIEDILQPGPIGPAHVRSRLKNFNRHTVKSALDEVFARGIVRATVHGGIEVWELVAMNGTTKEQKNTIDEENNFFPLNQEIVSAIEVK